MRKGVGIVVTVFVLLLIGVAGGWAAEVEGTIQTFDAGDRMIVLQDGTKLWIAEGLTVDSLKEGATVKASYEERDGKNVVTNFEVSE